MIIKYSFLTFHCVDFQLGSLGEYVFRSLLSQF